MSDITSTINASAGDAEEVIATTVVTLTDQNLPLSSTYKTGFLFPSVAVPKGSIITAASIQFSSGTGGGGTTVNITIKGEAADNSALFQAVNGNISGRSTTSASVIWTPPTFGYPHLRTSDEKTPELKTIVQEIVNRSGWSLNNNMTFILTGDATNGAAVASYDYSSSYAATLSISYTPASGKFLMMF